MNDELNNQFDPTIGPQPFIKTRFDLFTADQIVRLENRYKEEILKMTQRYGRMMVEVHVWRCKNEWFYKMFFEFDRCSVINDMDNIYQFFCNTYSLTFGQDKLISDSYRSFRETKDPLTRKFLLLIFIGEEQSVRDHIIGLVKKCVSSNSGKNIVKGGKLFLDVGKVAHLVIEKTTRLIEYLPKMVEYICNHSNINRYNICNLAATILYNCMILYESGTELRIDV